MCRNTLTFKGFFVGVLFSALTARVALAQASLPAVEWEFVNKFGFSYAVGISAKQTPDGGYFVLGTGHIRVAPEKCDVRVGFAERILTQVLLLKLDPEGHLDPAWPENPKTLEILGQQYRFRSAAYPTSDGGYIMQLEENTLDCKRGSYLLKIAPEGDLDPAWQENPRRLSPPAGDKFPSTYFRPTSDGGYIGMGVGGSLAKFDSLGNLDPSWPVNPKRYDNIDFVGLVRETADHGYIGVSEKP